VGPHKELPVDKYDYWRGFAGNGIYEHVEQDGNYKDLTQIMGEQAIEFLQGCSPGATPGADKPGFAGQPF